MKKKKIVQVAFNAIRLITDGIALHYAILTDTSPAEAPLPDIPSKGYIMDSYVCYKE